MERPEKLAQSDWQRQQSLGKEKTREAPVLLWIKRQVKNPDFLSQIPKEVNMYNISQKIWYLSYI